MIDESLPGQKNKLLFPMSPPPPFFLTFHCGEFLSIYKSREIV